MDTMINALPQEKREAMMIDMMPSMMEGIDMNELMPRMMSNMLKDISADDIVGWLKDTLKDKERFAELGTKLQEANLMSQMIFRVDRSGQDFEETVAALTVSAEQNGWTIPDTRDLQREYHEAGLEDMTRCTVLYFFNAEDGYAILSSSDKTKAMSVMMPMGVSVYETTGRQVEIAAMDLGLMSHFFSGAIKDVLKDSSARYERSLEAVRQTKTREAQR
jgi:uncharacterized protein (DUF302 family)